jgi:two-component system NarL family response regulator
MSTNTRNAHALRGGRHTAAFGLQNLPRSIGPRIQQILENPSIPGPVPVVQDRVEMQMDDREAFAVKKFPEERLAPWTVLLADDHPVVREGLTVLINRRQDMQVVGQASNGREALDQFLRIRPDVTLLDLRMPLLDGIDAIAAICEKAPEARLIILTTYQNEEDIYRALQAGAQGYLLKSANVEEVAECIRAVVSGRTWVPPGVGAKLAKRIAGQELTARELEVLRVMAAGKSNKEIGVALDISEGTVKVHMTHILEKLKSGGRTEAIRVAVEKGLVCLDLTNAA